MKFLNIGMNFIPTLNAMGVGSATVGFFTISSLLLMTGCTNFNTNSYNDVTDGYNGMLLPDTPNALQIISQESQKALVAQQMLVAYREQYNNTLDYRQYNFTTDNVKIDYIGKPQALLSSIAIKYGYRFIEYGAERELPTVNFTDYWGTPENILVNLSSQLSAEAAISVDKEQKVITLNYL